LFLGFLLLCMLLSPQFPIAGVACFQTSFPPMGSYLNDHSFNISGRVSFGFTSVSDLVRKLRRYINAYSAADPVKMKSSDPARRFRE
jgi:hypothetical protein